MTDDNALRVLVIDDEEQIRRFLRFSLETNGYRIYEAETGKAGLSAAARVRPDIIVLDLGLPDMSGFAVLKRLREWSQSPVIILSVHNADKDKVQALDGGADDYLTKPFSVEELMARMRAVIRLMQPEPEMQSASFAGIEMDFIHRTVTKHGKPVKLTPTEFSLLKLMATNAGRVLTHQQILREVWGQEYANETHYLRVYFAQLRLKLEDNPTLPVLLLTEPGVGYRLQVE